MSKEKHKCIIPFCPMFGAAIGKRKSGESKGYKKYCRFHKKPSNRNKFHPTVEFKERYGSQEHNQDESQTKN